MAASGMLGCGSDRSPPSAVSRFGLTNLENDPVPVREVLRQVHGGHAAGAQLALDPVAVGKGGGKAI
jgi:hypothetical protein